MKYLRCMTLVLVVFLAFAGGCAGPQGPHVRFALASGEEIRAAQASGETVWYDFEPGDDVPLRLGLVGVATAIGDQPTRMIAQRSFSIVVFPNGGTAFSFDGQTLLAPAAVARWAIALGAEEGGRGEAAIVLFIGEAADVPSELR